MNCFTRSTLSLYFVIVSGRPRFICDVVFQLRNWDDLVAKRSLLKYEEVRGPDGAPAFGTDPANPWSKGASASRGQQARLRRLAGIGAADDRRATAAGGLKRYGYGHGLRGWYGEKVD